MQRHDEEVPTSESTSILNNLAQVVRDKPQRVVQLVLLVGSTHHLLEVAALLRHSCLCSLFRCHYRLNGFILSHFIVFIFSSDRVTSLAGLLSTCRRGFLVGIDQLLGEPVQNDVVLSRCVLSDRLEAEYALTLRIDSHPLETFPLVRSHIRVEVATFHLKDGRSLIAQGVQGLDQGRAHQLLLAVEVFANILELVDGVKLHGCYV